MGTERYIKAGIISGIVLVGFTIALGIVPSFTDRYNHFFDEKPPQISKDEVNKKFLESKEYQAFTQRFPEHDTDFYFHEERDSRFVATAYNDKTQNALVLHLRYDFWDEDIDPNAECYANKRVNGVRYNAGDTLVTPFIKSTTCLD